MATGMRLWTVIAVGLMAILAVSLLPLEPPTTAYRSQLDRLDARRAGVLREVTALNVRLKRIRWVDSLRSEMASAREAGEAFAFGYAEGLEGEGAEWARETLAEAVSAEPGHDVYFGTFFVQERQGSYPGAARTYRPEAHGSEWYADRLPDGTPYCMQVISYDQAHPERTFTRYLSRGATSALGLCRLWLRYGEPGPEIRAWLAAGASAYAAAGEPTPEERAMLDGPLARQRRAMGSLLGGFLAVDLSTQSRRCVTGVAGACADLFFDPEVMQAEGRRSVRVGPEVARDVTPLVGSDAQDRSRVGYWFNGIAGMVFNELQRDFGRTAFEAFWRSEEPPARAFRTAFDADPDDWYRGEIAVVAGAPERGPLPRTATVGLLALVLLASAGVGVWTSRRRAVG